MGGTQRHAKHPTPYGRTEIPQLVRRLGSRKRACADAARARLSLIGARAVGDLVEALEGGDNRVRARVMPLLAMIQDPRGRAPLTAMLLDRSYRLRAIAAQSLGRFATPDAIAALKRVLERDRSVTVRVAAVRALVEQYVAGQDSALGCLLTCLGDAGESVPARLAAISVIPRLPAAQRRALLDRLRNDPEQQVRRRAEGLADLGSSSVAPGPDEVTEWIRELGSKDYAAWNHAVQQLGTCGTDAIGPLVDEMGRRSHDPELCTRAGIALKAMGPRRSRKIADAMERVDEALALLVLVEVIGSLGQKAQIYRLKDLIDRIAGRPAEERALDPMQQVRARAHLELARVGSRVAIQDLRDCLADAGRPIEIELLSAVRRIGKRDEIAILLRGYTRLDARRDEVLRGKLAEAVRAILRRERIRRNNKMFQALRPDLLAALAEILPPRGTLARRPTP